MPFARLVAVEVVVGTLELVLVVEDEGGDSVEVEVERAGFRVVEVWLAVFLLPGKITIQTNTAAATTMTATIRAKRRRRRWLCLWRRRSFRELGVKNRLDSGLMILGGSQQDISRIGFGAACPHPCVWLPQKANRSSSTLLGSSPSCLKLARVLSWLLPALGQAEASWGKGV